MLDNIISLSDLLTRQKTYKVELIDEIRGATTKIGRLYENVANGNLTTEEDAAAFLGYFGSQDKNYSNLKERLFDRMINSIFFVDQTIDLYKDPMTAAKNSYKNFAAIRLLIGNRKRDVAINLALKTIRITKKYEFSDLNYLLNAVLAEHYLLHTLNKVKYLHYKRQRDVFLEILTAENEIKELQGLFDISLSKSSSGISEFELKKHQKQLKLVKEKQKHIVSYRYNMHVYLFQINLYLETCQFAEILTTIDEAFKFFEEKGTKSVDVIVQLISRAGIANLMLQNYYQAETNFQKLLEYSHLYSVNWYSAHNYLVTIYLYANRFADAHDLISRVIGSENIEKTHPLLIQLFKIKEAYIHFLVQLGKVYPAESSEKPLRKFRLNRFLNDVPTYSKDKRGVNISILIIQMILLVQNKKLGEIVDKLDALKMYSHRYLRSDNTFRSNCFIKMLVKLPDADYHPMRWERYVKKFRDRLDEHPFELSYHNLDIEVIPFETLYQLVVEMLYQQKGLEMPV